MSGITLMLLGNHAGAAGVTPAALWGWGGNYNGAAARNSTEAGGRFSSPVQLGSASDWVEVQGSYNFVATRESGYLYNCGDRRFGGWNTALNTSSPVQIGSLTNWTGPGTMLKQNGRGASAIKSDGTLWKWGDNQGGVMGINQSQSVGPSDPYLYYSSPVQVGSLTNWSFCTGGGSGPACAINNAGELFTWGAAGSGALGNNTASGDVSSPVQIGSLTDWATGASQLGSGSNSVFILLKTDGSAWVWGSNDYGQVGVDSRANVSSPVQLGSDTDWGYTGCGYQQMGAVKSGKLYLWGRNNNGEVGDNTKIDRSSPVQVGALTTWQAVEVGNGMAMALKTDGTLWAWGANWEGQMGQDNLLKYSSPVQIGSLTDWSRIHCGSNGSSTFWGLKA